MAPAYFLVFSLLSHLLLPLLAQDRQESHNPSDCLPYYCGDPKENDEHHSPEFGWLTVNDCVELVQKFRLEMGRKSYDVISISPADTIDLQWYSDFCKCNYSAENFNCSTSPSITFRTTSNLKCNHSTPSLKYLGYIIEPECKGLHGTPPPQCLDTHPPINITHKDNRLFSLLAADIFFHVRVSESCSKCYFKGHEYKDGKCYKNINETMPCVNEDKASPPEQNEDKGKDMEDKGNPKTGLKRRLGLGIGIPVVLIICFLILFFGRRHYKQKHASSDFLMRNISADPASKSELDRGGVYFGVPIFSYNELEEATNNFDPSKELGDGGFGTVYHGKLQDGREVAVKRLYENSYKRVEQFMNEVEILTRLRHKNLVSLYGCTSRHSRELLLVYEFIPNGTVADHLHGDRAKPGSLTWPIRMSIAIETAEALTYLHATDIIHRDVKTNNILLDNNFCVKVADFGLSRLFPINCTHVSTAPQGTPGYLDPEYHQCYQLTDKSDVYSFGVVLIELISSLPPVDISRHRHEINLANLAINKIQNSAFNELVDPCLGFESNLVVRRMMTSVAELAFRCLQHDKEMRPYMDEVLEVLKGIESEECEAETVKETDDNDVGVMKCTRAPFSPDSNANGMLMKMQLPHSLNYMTEKPVHGSTRPNASI